MSQLMSVWSVCVRTCVGGGACAFETVMVTNAIISSPFFRGAQSFCRNLHAPLAAPVARPRERRQVVYFTLVSRLWFVFRGSKFTYLQCKHTLRSTHSHTTCMSKAIQRQEKPLPPHTGTVQICVMCSILPIRVSSATRKGESLEAIPLRVLNSPLFPLAEGFLSFFLIIFCLILGDIGTRHLFFSSLILMGRLGKAYFKNSVCGRARSTSLPSN